VRFAAFFPRPLLEVLLNACLASSGRFSQNPTEQLRAILRAYPFWLKGHLELGRLSMLSGDVATTYASAQAARMMSKAGSIDFAKALHLLGQCFMARGDWMAALPYFQDAKQALPRDPSIIEDEAAALMLGGMFDEATALLCGIPSDKLSAHGKAALEFSKTHSKA